MVKSALAAIDELVEREPAEWLAPPAGMRAAEAPLRALLRLARRVDVDVCAAGAPRPDYAAMRRALGA